MPGAQARRIEDGPKPLLALRQGQFRMTAVRDIDANAQAADRLAIGTMKQTAIQTDPDNAAVGR